MILIAPVQNRQAELRQLLDDSGCLIWRLFLIAPDGCSLITDRHSLDVARAACDDLLNRIYPVSHRISLAFSDATVRLGCRGMPDSARWPYPILR